MILLLVLSCSPDEMVKPSAERREILDTGSTVTSPTLPEVSESEVGEGSIEPVERAPARRLKRMTVAQARDSMVQISGGVHWGSEGESYWDEYSETLGVADYQLRVENDRSPSVMFQKFLDDAATATCMGWIQAPETTFFAVEDRASMVREDIVANIVSLRWQIQGKVKDATVPIIEDYETLFVKAHQRTESTESAWQTVCVAMFTHPDFFMY